MLNKISWGGGGGGGFASEYLVLNKISWGGGGFAWWGEGGILHQGIRC